MEFETVNIGGVPTACLGRQKIADLISERCLAFHAGVVSDPFVIFSNNGHAISIANSDPSYMKQLREADLIHADGQSVVSFSKWLKGPSIPERSATTDMIHDIPKFVKRPLRHFLLGGSEKNVKAAATILSQEYDNFKLAGAFNGYFEESYEKILCDKINESNADVLWVGLGKPKEQMFCLRNKNRLTVPIIITCGGCYNYITGDYPRAPMWVQRIGFEWMHRMISNPRKLLFRYVTTNPHAVYCVLKNRGVIK